jgi:hypothetical protein
MLRKVNNLDMDRWRSIKMESAFLRSLIQSGKTKRKNTYFIIMEICDG